MGAAAAMPLKRPSSPLLAALREALEVERQLVDLRATREGKVTAEEFLADALTNAQPTTEERIARLRKEVDGPLGNRSDRLYNLKEAVQRMVRHIVRPDYTRIGKGVRGFAYVFSTADPDSNGRRIGRDTTAAAELKALDFKPEELLCVAVRLAVAQRGDSAFGRADDWTNKPDWQQKRDARIRDLTARRDALLVRIDQVFAFVDVEFAYTDSEGRIYHQPIARLTAPAPKASGKVWLPPVELYPRDTLPARLLEYATKFGVPSEVA